LTRVDGESHTPLCAGGEGGGVRVMRPFAGGVRGG